MTLGEMLRKAREAKGWSQVYVSKILGITSQSLSNYERGERDPDTTTLNCLAQIYGVTTDYLLGLTDENSVMTYQGDFLGRKVFKWQGELYWGPIKPGESIGLLTTIPMCFSLALPGPVNPGE